MARTSCRLARDTTLFLPWCSPQNPHRCCVASAKISAQSTVWIVGGWGPSQEASMFLLLAVALAGSIIIAALLSYSWSMVRDVGDAQEELRRQVLQFYRVALS